MKQRNLRGREWIVLALVLLAIFAVGTVCAYADTTLSDAPGNAIVQGLKSFASGGWGKALFFCALIGGIIGLLSQHHRKFGLIALVFGILLGVYGGVGDSLWNLFTSWGNGQ